MIEHFSIQRTQLSSGEGNHKVTKKKTTKNLLIEDSPAFFSQLENSCQPEKKQNKTKQKHSPNQSELTNYLFLPWKRNIPFTMPKSNLNCYEIF